ncbi:hypothetical protein QTP88_015783 [Uroleucon formosanum]
MPSHMNCCFNKCTNSSRSTQNLSFHKFPTNESLCKQWVELCQNDKVIQKFKNHGSSQVSKSFRICSEHFKREDYVLWTSKKKSVYLPTYILYSILLLLLLLLLSSSSSSSSLSLTLHVNR